MKKNEWIEIAYHCSVVGFVFTMIVTLITFRRPIEPNIYIAAVEVVIGLMVLVYAGNRMGRILLSS